MHRYKAIEKIYARMTIDGITYEARYTDDTKVFRGFAWLIYTNKGGQRLYPATWSPESAIRHWASGNKPILKHI